MTIYVLSCNHKIFNSVVKIPSMRENKTNTTTYTVYVIDEFY